MQIQNRDSVIACSIRFEEPLRNTLIRTGIIAIGIASFRIFRSGNLTPFPTALYLTMILANLWFTFGGHWVEIFYRNYLVLYLPVIRFVQVLVRLAVWFIGGSLLAVGMQATWILLQGTPPSAPPWWLSGIAFIVVELIVHWLLLHARGKASIYNGKG